jgi:GT2 family glycosyltransferase
MNAAAGEAGGDVLLFLHADTVLPDDAARRIADALIDPDTVAGAFRTWTVADAPRPWFAPLMHLADVRSRYSGLPYGDQAMFVRTAVFRALGGFPALPLMEDVELSRRLRRRGRIRVVDACVQTSGRRFAAHPIYYTLAMNLLPVLHRLGVPPATLRRLYGDVR